MGGSKQKFSSTNLATPVSCVSAFCQAVIKKVIPRGFWGAGEMMEQNQRVILQKVDQFLRARKFETLFLEEIMSTLKVVPPSYDSDFTLISTGVWNVMACSDASSRPKDVHLRL